MRRPLWQYLLGLVLLTGIVLLLFLFPQLNTYVKQGRSALKLVLMWAAGVALLLYVVVSLAAAVLKRRLKNEQIRRGHDTTRLEPPKDQEQGPAA
jgi:uncharacterized membrane protein